MRRTKNYGRSKKREWQQREAETSEIVDDLAHAATFALMASPSPSAAPVAPTGAPDNDDGEEDDNEIEVMDDDEASSSEEDEDGLGVTGEEEKKSTENESDDDDESDVDLAEAVAKMQEQEDAEDEPATAKISAPKTEHELDAYQTPIQELEKHLQFQLTVEDESGYGAGPPKLRHLDSEHLSLAGRVKHYMATDRTVVVESNPPLNGSANAPLDEGSFLVVRRPAVDEASLGDGTNSNGFIPLGRIFEVFGPVTQPLYTIRLPIPPSSHAKNATKRSQQKLDKNDEVVETTTIALSSIEKNDSGSSSSEEKKLETSKTEENPETGGEACKLATEKADASCESSAFVSLALKEGRSDNNDNFTGDSESMKKIPKESDEQLDGVEHGTSKVTGADQEFKDPWAPGGEFAQLISLKNQNISVYFVKDEAKLIDTGAVMRMSGKGCDASNLYDEEVVHTNEMYYSDDEKERQSKNRHRQGKERQNQRNRSHPNGGGSIVPQGFHQPQKGYHQNQQLQGFHQPSPPPPPAPHGFYQQPPQASPYYASYPPNMGQQPTPYPYPNNTSVPPPPPPPQAGTHAPPPAYPTAPPPYQY